MTRVDEFDSFVRSTFAQVVQVTYAACGDRQTALEATTEAYRRAWRDWSKIRDRSPRSHVREEAFKATSIIRSTHPLRRRHEEDADVELLDALAKVDVDERRLIILMTVGATDLEEASREVGVSEEDGIEQVTNGLAALEKSLGQSIDQIERRMQALSDTTDQLKTPEPAGIRRAAKRGVRRNTVLIVAAAVIGVIGAGVVTTDDDALATQAALPQREKLGAEGKDIVLDARKIDTDDLLSPVQVGRLDPTSRFTLEGTDDDIESTTPYATCPTERFADPDPLRVFVRTFTGDRASNERVAQSIEVSSSEEVSRKAEAKIIRSFADCQHPRVQLVASYVVKRPFGDFTVLRLRSNGPEKRTFTVGFSQSGSVTSTLVHEVDGTRGPDLIDFARTLNDSVLKVCTDSGGRCGERIQISEADPPRTTDAPAFLAIVDLPPIADVNRVWAAADADSEPNPAATPCDKADFSGEDVQMARSRVFVLYQATEVPQEFGITETIGRFGSPAEAKKFVAKVGKRISSCPDDNLGASIDQTDDIATDETDGQVWRVGLEVDDDENAYYRVGLIRRGSDVAQVTFTPAGDYDVSLKEFTGIVSRAGVRLKYADLQD